MDVIDSELRSPDRGNQEVAGVSDASLFYMQGSHHEVRVPVEAGHQPARTSQF